MANENDAHGVFAELEDVIRTVPDIYFSWGAPEHFEWLGRARAILSHRLVDKEIEARVLTPQALSNQSSSTARGQILVLLQNARHQLRMATVGPIGVAVGKGMSFEYFDHLRRLIEQAQSDLFFVDPYLDADFVSKYLPFTRPGVTIRLLARERIKTLTPAVKAFVAQHGNSIEVRIGSGFHDRYLFVDQRNGIASGASFKDGGFKTPTVLLELSDTLSSVMDIYEKLWGESPITS
ncbi:hypothetical protein RU07_17610 [Agrobacterium tumefaciens]|uniref:Uncharacterized protein n=1 Tax=Agrobacterium tumefaciens TaxID=358 RepID=A0A0D0KPP7_AGRTU|nr:hypothetical protein RU07_17610 [Agrobacterium tumefaciens]